MSKRYLNGDLRTGSNPSKYGAPVHHHRIDIQTWLDPKGWAWRVLMMGEIVARGRHHSPTEDVALAEALHGFASVRRQVIKDPESVRLYGDARDALSGLAGRLAGPSRKVPVRLVCGHIRVVREGKRSGSSVNCGVCLTHVEIAEFLMDETARKGD